jgi:hypothetical protein
MTDGDGRQSVAVKAGPQVAVLAAGFIALACVWIMWRDFGDIMGNLATGASFLPHWYTWPRELISAAPAAAGVLTAVAGLGLRGRARWLRYLQIGLWLLALASSLGITAAFAPFSGLAPLYGPIIVGGSCAVVSVALLTLSLRRPAGRPLRWQWGLVLLAAALPVIAAVSGPRYAYGPGYGTAVGIVTRCPSAEAKADGSGPGLARVTIVSAENQAGKVVASQRLPVSASGARYRMRLPAGTYSINLSTDQSDGYTNYDDWLYIPAGQADEMDFNDSGGCAW